MFYRVPTVDGDKTLSVREGTQSGDRLRMRGYGVPTLNGRGRGDQYVHIKYVQPPTPPFMLLGLISDSQRACCTAVSRSPS